MVLLQGFSFVLRATKKKSLTNAGSNEVHNKKTHSTQTTTRHQMLIRVPLSFECRHSTCVCVRVCASSVSMCRWGLLFALVLVLFHCAPLFLRALLFSCLCTVFVCFMEMLKCEANLLMQGLVVRATPEQRQQMISHSCLMLIRCQTEFMIDWTHSIRFERAFYEEEEASECTRGSLYRRA